MSKKEEETKTETKPSSKKTNKPKEELKTLIELANNSDIDRFTLIIRLNKNGYLNQFYDEELKFTDGIYIKPSITESEFKKIIGG